MSNIDEDNIIINYIATKYKGILLFCFMEWHSYINFYQSKINTMMAELYLKLKTIKILISHNTELVKTNNLDKNVIQNYINSMYHQISMINEKIKKIKELERMLYNISNLFASYSISKNEYENCEDIIFSEDKELLSVRKYVDELFGEKINIPQQFFLEKINSDVHIDEHQNDNQSDDRDNYQSKTVDFDIKKINHLIHMNKNNVFVNKLHENNDIDNCNFLDIGSIILFKINLLDCDDFGRQYKKTSKAVGEVIDIDIESSQYKIKILYINRHLDDCEIYNHMYDEDCDNNNIKNIQILYNEILCYCNI